MIGFSDFSLDWREKFPDAVTASGNLKKGISQDKKTEVFIYRAKQVHGGIYGYEGTIYATSADYVIVKCALHGNFSQKASNHLRGDGCPSCSGNIKKTNRQFVDEAIQKHGPLFDYSKTNYVNTHSNVTIICKLHGEFNQSPANHLRGQGCPKCGGTLRKTLPEFIEDCASIHGSRYDYSLVSYINSDTKVKIICNHHGIFEQRPDAHLTGQGCPGCFALPDKLYILTDGRYFKIGISSNIEKRRKELSRGMRVDLQLVAHSDIIDNAKQLESILHSKYPYNPYIAEVFDGYSEWRVLSAKDLKEIIEDFSLIEVIQ